MTENDAVISSVGARMETVRSLIILKSFVCLECQICACTFRMQKSSDLTPKRNRVRSLFILFNGAELHRMQIDETEVYIDTFKKD